MSFNQQRLADYLAHILEAIERIKRYTDDMDEVAFLGNLLVQDAVVRNLEIIGEASNNIQKRFPEFAANHQEVPLAFAYQMRNVVAHGYFKIDYEIVWNTIQQELPNLYRLVRSAAEDLQRDRGRP